MNAIQKAKKAVILALAVAATLGTIAPASAQLFSYGVYCQTPAGIFGPGAPLPLGSACWARTFYGPVWGYIV